LDYATSKGEVALDESASAALAADNAYNVSCLLDDLNLQAAGDVSPAGEKCRCKDGRANDQICS
jgi:hypothetical protein